jgi:hypothetical protein
VTGVVALWMEKSDVCSYTRQTNEIILVAVIMHNSNDGDLQICGDSEAYSTCITHFKHFRCCDRFYV